MTLKDLADMPLAVHWVEEDHRDPAWIVDIDGTLAHRSCTVHQDGHHLQSAEREDGCHCRSPYDETRVHEDLSCPIITELVQMLSKKYYIIVCSGRSEACRSDTAQWLRDNEIPYTNLFMRAEGDNRKDSVVKLELLDKYILPSFDVRGVLDDRQQVVDAWRSRGLKTLQVEPGNF